MLYDSSVFPCPAYYTAKAAAISLLRMRGRQSRSIIDDPRVALVLAGISGLSAAWAARLIFARMQRRTQRDRTAEAEPAPAVAAH